MKLVLATKNKGKAGEIMEKLSGLDIEITTLDDYPPFEFPEEDQPTFSGNALMKARVAAFRTGRAALADDSGLEVDALDGRPGIYSARYAGVGATDRENYEKLLTELDGLPPEQRKARFRCVLALVEPGGDEETFEGEFEGMIAERPSGEGGFGYDPVFYVPERKLTVAELTPEEKNSISHRAAALDQLKKRLSEKLSQNTSARKE